MAKYIILLMLAFCAQAEIYKWVDSEGNVHFGDRSHAGAEKIVLAPLQSYGAPKSELPAKEQVKLDTERKIDEVNYQLQIAKPTDKATFHSNPGEIEVTVNLTPALQPNYKIRILVDNKVMTETAQLTVLIAGIERGEHTVKAQLIDSANRVITSSQTITVYMHKVAIPLRKKL